MDNDAANINHLPVRPFSVAVPEGVRDRLEAASAAAAAAAATKGRSNDEATKVTDEEKLLSAASEFGAARMLTRMETKRRKSGMSEDNPSSKSKPITIAGRVSPALATFDDLGEQKPSSLDDLEAAVARVRKATEAFTGKVHASQGRIHTRSFSAPDIIRAVSDHNLIGTRRLTMENKRPKSTKLMYSARPFVPEPDAGSAFDDALTAQQRVLRTKRTKHFRKVARRRYIRKKKKGEITREHEFYNLSYCMMIGIRYTVGRQAPPKPKNTMLRHGPLKGMELNIANASLSVDDFMHVDKFIFPPGGGTYPNPTPPHRLQSKFKFKDYSSDMFRALRKQFNINDADYMMSLCGNFNFIEFISNSKSGQFFFYSHDGKYLIKTQSKTESKFLRRIFPQYYMYMMDNPNSTIVRFLGMHRVKVPHIRRRMHFVIMNSVFCDPLSRRVHTVYDLKGSTIGRAAKPGQSVLKDLDLLDSGRKFRFGPLADGFMNQLASDADFLRELKIMDYSLLIGIHSTSMPKNVAGNVNRESVTVSGVAGNDKSKGKTMTSNSASSDAALETITEDSVVKKHEAPPSPEARKESRGEGRLSRNSSSHSDLHQYNSEEEFYESPDEKDRFASPPANFGKYACVESCDEDGAPDGQEVYFLGIIDILQQYNLKKITENMMLSTFKDGTKISAVKPSLYASRFVKFMKKLVK